MQERWFYCEKIVAGQVSLEASELHHALRSLRLRAGDAITLFDGRGTIAAATLTLPAAARGARPTEATAAAQAQERARSRKAPERFVARVERIEHVPPPQRTLTLIVAGCKKARLDWLVEKCTELGASRIQLTEFERSVVRAGRTHGSKLIRTAIEACKQCRRAWLTDITAGVALGEAIAVESAARVAAALLVADPGEGAVPLGEWLHADGAKRRHVAVVVGPEGGLTPGELEALRSAGARRVTLGDHVLRVETAAVAVAAAWASAGSAQAAD